MKIKMSIIILICVFTLSIASFAEKTTPPKPILKAGDVEKFIKTFPVLADDFKALGAKYDSKEGNVTFPEALKANSEFQAILNKHGWDNTFFQKVNAITMGYSAIMYAKEIKNANPELEKALKEIDSNTALSAELKKQMKEGILAAQGALKNQDNAFLNMVAPADMQLITPFVTQLKNLFDKMK